MIHPHPPPPTFPQNKYFLLETSFLHNILQLNYRQGSYIQINGIKVDLLDQFQINIAVIRLTKKLYQMLH